MTKARPENLADYVSEAALRRPDAAALIVGATRLTWADVDSLVTSTAAGLRSAGLTAGDRVGLVVGNRPEFVQAYVGALRAGLVAVPLNPGFTPPEIGRLLGHADVRLVVADRESVAAVRSAELPGVTRIVVGVAPEAGEVSFDDLIARGVAEGAGEEPRPDAEQLAVILYTSGTSGAPKGAMLTHRALIASVEQVASLDRPVVTPDDTVLIVLPLAHVYSLNGTLGAVLRQGAAAILVDSFEPAATLRLAKEHRVTNIPGAPSLWSAWAEEPGLADSLAGVRMLFNGSDALPPEVQRTIRETTGLDVHEGYGLTEAAPGVSSTLVSGAVKPGSVGQPFPGVEVRLVDEDGQEVDPDEHDPGEIWIRGDNLFSGYWPDGDDGPDDDGWYATGDVAFTDDDGDLHVVDRRKELIIVNGFNVYPREIEEVLLQHPDVEEAAVVGMPDPRTGEAVKAYAVTRSTATTATDLLGFTELRLARFKRPSQVEIVSELPHSLTGKVVKGRLPTT